MGSDEKKMKSTEEMVGGSGTQTGLMEEMKLLKGMHDDSGLFP